MSSLQVSPPPFADDPPPWTCLLPCSIADVSRSVSSLAFSLSRSSLAHSHASALACLLDRLLAGSPRPHRPANEPGQARGEVNLHGFFPNSLVQLDVFRVLLFAADGLHRVLSILARSLGHDAQESLQITAGTREEVGLLDEREVHNEDSSSCFDRISAFFLRGNSPAVQEAAGNGMETDGSELRKRLMEFVVELQEYLDRVELSVQRVLEELSSTVKLLVDVFMFRQHRSNCSTIACLRRAIRSFLYTRQEEFLPLRKLADLGSCHQDEMLSEKADVVMKQLLNPHDAKIVGLGGGEGFGKTCLASIIACNNRIGANFPGGVFYIYVGPEPELTCLQAQLWKEMWQGSICNSPSKVVFVTPEEGTAALKSRAQEGLPCLLILDDVCDVDHLKPFLCFDSENGGRVLVISRTVESILENWKDDRFLLILESWNSEEACNLFKSVSGCQDAEKLAALTKYCQGTPRLIEAAASILYYGEVSLDMLPSISSSVEEGKNNLADSEARSPDISISTSSVVTLEGQKIPEALHKWDKKVEQSTMPESYLLDFADSKHYLFLDTLAEVHPGLQECFLDLAAFPKGTWVSLSMIMDIWSCGNTVEKEKATFVLCFLASRSLVEWRMEVSVDDDSGQIFPSYWRLVEQFHELAQEFIERRLEDASKDANVENQSAHKSESSPYKCACNAKSILELLRSALSSVNTFTLMQSKQIASYRICHESEKLHDGQVVDFQSRKDVFSFSMLLQTNFRLFSPGSQWDNCAAPLTDENIANKITKLSLISTNLTKFPAKVDLCQLKVALLSSNPMLKSLPERPFRCMQNLVILNLKHCSSLTSLPESICTLPFLEGLELSFCTGLLLLPQTIGKLDSLKYLNLSGCLSLTCLPASTGSLKNLMTLDLSACSRLRKLPKTVGNLKCLQVLNLFGCYSLQCLPKTLGALGKLQSLVVSGCTNLTHKPPWYGLLMNIMTGRMNGAMAIHPQVWRLRQIEELHFCSLKNLTFLPKTIRKLQHLRHLNLGSCRSLDYLPDEIGSLFLLENLDLSHTAIRKLPSSLGQLSSLVRLCLQGCSRLLCLPPTMCDLSKLERLEMAECWDFVMLPDEFGAMHSLPKLIELDLSGCSVKTLPFFTKGALPMIQRLCLSSCENLSTLPSTFGTLTSLARLDVGGCKSLVSLLDIGFGDLKQLQWLNLRNCMSLTVLPVSELLSLQYLRFLDVSGCTNLFPFPEPLLLQAKEQKFTLVRWGALWH